MIIVKAAEAGSGNLKTTNNLISYLICVKYKVR